MAIMSIPLASSMLSSATYDSDNKTLDLVFNNGRSYTYESVPQEIADGLFAAPSAGRYYLNMIKDQFSAR